MFSIPEGGGSAIKKMAGNEEVLFLRAFGANNISREVQLCNLRFDEKKY